MIYLDQHQAAAFRSGSLKCLVQRQRKVDPHPGDVLQFVAGSWGKNEPLGARVCKAVRPVFRDGQKWYFGMLGQRFTISQLESRQLAEDCGYPSVNALNEKFASEKKPLVKVSW